MHSGKSVILTDSWQVRNITTSLVYSSARSTDSAVVSGSVLIPCNPKRWTDNMHLEQPAQSLLEENSMPSNTALAACIRVTSSRSRTSPELKLDFHFPARGKRTVLAKPANHFNFAPLFSVLRTRQILYENERTISTFAITRTGKNALGSSETFPAAGAVEWSRLYHPEGCGSGRSTVSTEYCYSNQCVVVSSQTRMRETPDSYACPEMVGRVRRKQLLRLKPRRFAGTESKYRTLLVDRHRIFPMAKFGYTPSRETDYGRDVPASHTWRCANHRR